MDVGPMSEPERTTISPAAIGPERLLAPLATELSTGGGPGGCTVKATVKAPLLFALVPGLSALPKQRRVAPGGTVNVRGPAPMKKICWGNGVVEVNPCI